jgi:hypothetical protein
MHSPPLETDRNQPIGHAASYDLSLGWRLVLTFATLNICIARYDRQERRYATSGGKQLSSENYQWLYD